MFRYSPCLLLCFFSGLALADLPIGLKEILTPERTLKVGFGIDYFNTTDPYTASHQSDTLIYSDLTYGFSEDLEVYGKVYSRYVTETNVPSHGYFDRFLMGGRYRFETDNDYSALSGFAEITLIENKVSEHPQWVTLPSATIGISAYHSLDPLVFMLTSGYQYHTSRSLSDGQSINQGNVFFIKPNIGFIVNSEVTLMGGFSLSFQQPSLLNGEILKPRSSETELYLGMGYSFNKSDVISVEVQTNISSSEGANVGLKWTHKLNQRR